MRDSMEKYDSGRYSKLEFLSAVSHCSDITDTLGQDNSDTEEYYSWDESAADDSADSANNLQSSAVPVVSTATSSDNVCDICWLNPRAMIVFVPCAGHTRFCDSCARQMFASTKKCGICRQQIDLLLPVIN